MPKVSSTKEYSVTRNELPLQFQEEKKNDFINPTEVVADGILEVNNGVVQSSGFATGKAGWQLRDDGTAEFDNVVLRNPLKQPGSILYASANTNRSTTNTSYTLVKTITVSRGGTYRIYFELSVSSPGGNTITARIYKNGVAVGVEHVETYVSGAYTAYTEDISGFEPGDQISLYYKFAGTPGSGSVQNFRLYVSEYDTSTVTLD